MKILGIDPSLCSSGWVILDKNKLKDFGLIKTKKGDNKRLMYIYDSFKAILEEYKPDEVHIETPFIGLKGASVLELSQVRGIILLLMEQYDIPVVSFNPPEIKNKITGKPRAEKELVAEELTKLYKNDKMFMQIGHFSDKQNKNKTSDIYDALAVAVCEK